ncbi:MAG: M14 family metallocarboxypeptidase [Verrucomicrobia bacterium]|nr:M14 family metallocarboxypeptidase [Verrucomicrobiota bacterium]
MTTRSARRERLIGRAHGHALRLVELVPSPAQAERSIYLSTGIHGGEPAGVTAVKWLLSLPRAPRWMRPFRWTILPCLNPAGCEAGERENPDGLDLNRQFRRDGVPEIAAVKRAVRGRRFDLCIHLHEDCDGTGFYLYELNRRGDWMGEHIVAAVRSIIPPDRRKLIERRPARDGVICRRPQICRRKLWPEAIWAYAQITDHTLTIETPTSWPLGDRVRAQLKAIEAAARWLAESTAGAAAL